MAWNRSKQERLDFAKAVTAPFLKGEIDALREKRDEGKIPLTPVESLRLGIVDGDHETAAKIVENLETELTSLRYEWECEHASLRKKEILLDPKFLAACEAAGVAPTSRQASKWLRGRRGASVRAAGRIS